MFEIQVWHLLASYSWDSETLEFSWEVLPEFYEDLEFLSPLSFRLTLISTDDGIEVVMEDIETRVEYEYNEYTIEIPKISRTFKTHRKPEDPDDIKNVDMKHSTIDLKDILREEIIMICSVI